MNTWTLLLLGTLIVDISSASCNVVSTVGDWPDDYGTSLVATTGEGGKAIRSSD